MKKAAFYLMLTVLLYAVPAFAVAPSGGLGDNLIAALVNSARDVWLPALLFVGFVIVIGMMVLGRGGAFIQRFGFWILAIICVGGAYTYFSSFSGGVVSMTFTLPIR
jgi:hypothetical protein